MPPAFVLSQNQTLKLMYDLDPGGIPENETGISGSRSCTNIQTGVFAYEDIWNGINLTDQPEPRGSGRPGRRPHVPSSKPTMSKSRHASFPGSSVPGRLYRLRRGAKRTPTCCQAASAAGGAIYVEAPEASTGFFAIVLQFAVGAARSTATGASTLS